jgi:hypothetical protein
MLFIFQLHRTPQTSLQAAVRGSYQQNPAMQKFSIVAEVRNPRRSFSLSLYSVNTLRGTVGILSITQGQLPQK